MFTQANRKKRHFDEAKLKLLSDNDTFVSCFGGYRCSHPHTCKQALVRLETGSIMRATASQLRPSRHCTGIAMPVPAQLRLPNIHVSSEIDLSSLRHGYILGATSIQTKLFCLPLVSE